MRLFVALEIPQPVLGEISDLMIEVRANLPPGRWVRPEGIHLTLSFLGDTEADALPALEESLAGAFAAHAPFDLSIAGGGVFPSRRAARVAWIGVEAGPELEALQNDVAGAVTASLGLEPDGRPFHPHLTVARARTAWRQRAVEIFTRAAERSFGEPFTVRHGTLIESQLGPGGARYHNLATFPLAAAKSASSPSSSGLAEVAQGGAIP